MIANSLPTPPRDARADAALQSPPRKEVTQKDTTMTIVAGGGRKCRGSGGLRLKKEITTPLSVSFEAWVVESKPGELAPAIGPGIGNARHTRGARGVP